MPSTPVLFGDSSKMLTLWIRLRKPCVKRLDFNANIGALYPATQEKMHHEGDLKRLNTISPDGDIAVDGFEFPKLIWSKLIANVLKMCKIFPSYWMASGGRMDTRQPLSVVAYDIRIYSS
jgi:hypothetical protein